MHHFPPGLNYNIIREGTPMNFPTLRCFNYDVFINDRRSSPVYPISSDCEIKVPLTGQCM